ncbi:MAG: acyl-CoA/acyl-ACP dehydrogenase [Deltaproteobacteria bacterium]|nr:acyl-CoA/acyl-ACP dehydrogenase [Deltaproteobacteria bacterium]MBW2086104.1 acyl-CoA/acyl-ACP dehydrogenase [Deltaproteobacteria bacterium]
MAMRDLDFNLTDEQKAMRDMVRKFGAEVMRPAGIELDKMSDPADVIAKDSVLWDIYKKYRELGFHKRGISKACGGMLGDMDAMSFILVAEEMGYWDSGLAISFGVDSMPFALAAMSPDPELQGWARAYVEDTECKMVGCWAITEPDHGTDWLLRSEATNCPECKPNVKAVLKGDEYILQGQKSAWVSNGTMATHTNLHVSLDPAKGMAGTGLAVVRLDLPGITKGKPLDKIGQRSLNQGEIYFDDVRIPKNWMIVPNPALIEGAGEMGLARVNGGMGIVFAGLARAAFDEALKYARERIQGGVPIFEHQNIKLKLFKMYKMVEAACALSRRMGLYNAANPLSPSAPPAVASKVLSTETAFEVASEAIQILGGNGLSKEYPVEKMFRDARAAMIEDGVNESLSLAATQFM